MGFAVESAIYPVDDILGVHEDVNGVEFQIQGKLEGSKKGLKLRTVVGEISYKSMRNFDKWHSIGFAIDAGG